MYTNLRMCPRPRFPFLGERPPCRDIPGAAGTYSSPQNTYQRDAKRREEKRGGHLLVCAESPVEFVKTNSVYGL